MYSRPGKSDTGAYLKKLQVATGNGSLKTLRALSISEAADGYIMLFDSLAEPAPAAMPSAAPVPLITQGYYESDTPFEFKNGLWICVSSAPASLELAEDNSFWITAEFLY